MRKSFPSISAAAFGLGMFACSSLDAQIPTSSRTEAALAASKAPSETVKLRDANRLIGASVSTTSGKYGSIADLVVDGTGAVQYALVEREGKFHPVPFALMQFGATGDVTLSVSSASLDGITVDRNNLQSLTNREFAAQLRSAFGPNVAREVAASTGATATTGVASSRANRERVFSLAGMFGGSIAAKDGGSPGTIATAAINPNGTIAYFVGSNAAGDARFAVPFSQSTLNSNFNGISVDVSVQAIVTVSIPQNSLPTMADQSFAASLRNTFGSGITNDSRGIAGGIDGMTKQESDVLRRNDRSNSDPVAGAGDSRRGGADAVAGAGDSRRGGADAVARAGDRAMSSTQSNATTGSTTGGLVNAAPQTETTTQASVNSQSGLLQFRDLLNLRIQAQDGAFGRVSDIVLDQNGNVQYLLGSHQGQFFPLPLNQAALATAADGTLNYNVPMASLQNLSIDPRSLPRLTDSQFVDGMRQVFGTSFGANAQQSSSAYVQPNALNQQRQGTQSQTNSKTDSGSVDKVNNPPRANQSGTTGANSGWNWPNNPTFGQNSGRSPAPPPGSGIIDTRPGFNKGANSGRSPVPPPGSGIIDTRPGFNKGANSGRSPAPPPGSGIIDTRPGFNKGANKTPNPGKTGNSGSGGTGSTGSGNSGGTGGGSGSTSGSGS